MGEASEPAEKLPWEFLRVSRKRRERECNSSTDEPHSFVLALRQVAVEQTPRSGCAQLRLDPDVVGE
jgi:hypothetical protein